MISVKNTLYRAEQINQALSKHQEVGITSEKKVISVCAFLGPPWCYKKVNPEMYVSCGSYELLVSNVTYQMNEKLIVQKNFLLF